MILLIMILFVNYVSLLALNLHIELLNIPVSIPSIAHLLNDAC